MRLPLCLLLAAVTALPLRASDATRAHAFRAQARLAPETWSTVIQIENESRRSRYPKRFHALVFELVGVLWFYTSVDGTQSFSLHRNNLAAEKADFAPLLRDIDPGFSRWQTAEEELDRAGRAKEVPLPNGCFVESVAAFQALRAAGGPVADPQLLSYYAETARGRTGHTVLTYRNAGDIVVLDPTEGRTWTVPAGAAAEARKLAALVYGGPVAAARAISLAAPAALDPGTLIAGAEVKSAKTEVGRST